MDVAHLKFFVLKVNGNILLTKDNLLAFLFVITVHTGSGSLYTIDVSFKLMYATCCFCFHDFLWKKIEI